MFKVKNKDIRTAPMDNIRTAPCFSVSIVNFEQVNAGWCKLFKDITINFSNSGNSLIRDFFSLKFLVFNFLAVTSMQTVGFDVTGSTMPHLTEKTAAKMVVKN